MKTKPHVFATFPEFSKLTLGDRDKYQSLIAEYPPYADFSFPFLMTWWSGLSNCRISQLNGNLVIAYWLPGYEEYSGLSVLGTTHLDETFALIFDYLLQKGEQPRLVHIPEFVASNLRYPELFQFADERDYDECVLSVANLNAVGSLIRHKRWKVRRFMFEVNEDRVSVESLDLNDKANQRRLMEVAKTWEPRGGLNDICKHERDVLPIAITHAEDLGIENFCIFIDGQLHNFHLVQLSADSKHAINYFARISYDMPHLFEFIIYKTGQWLSDRGIEYFNIKYDLGVPKLRANKLSLAPANFFRKYTIKPSS